ncbi:MAG: LuxR C-terminal-related transcriptional regulator [Candidatus Dormibacteraceae bacterium]
MSGDPMRILIVENQRFVSDALQALLSLQPDMVVVGNVGSVADSVAELNPDIVILEFRLNDEMAAVALRTIFQADYGAKVIFLTSDEDDKVILAAIDGGASAVLYMSSAAAEVIQTIRTVAGGGSLISPGTIANLLNGRRKTDGVRDKLTRREMEILSLMAAGTSNREIAARLSISYTTVRCHVRNLSSKLAAHSQLEVLVRAQQLDLVDRRAAARASLERLQRLASSTSLQNL